MRLVLCGGSIMIGLVLTASACAPLGQPPAPTSASVPSQPPAPTSASVPSQPPAATSASVPRPPGSPSVPASPTSAQAGHVGYLDGRIVAVRPPRPVQRANDPTPAIPPAACASHGLVIFAANTSTEVARVSFAPDCTCRVALAPGSYRVELDQRGIERSPELPQQVTIADG